MGSHCHLKGIGNGDAGGEGGAPARREHWERVLAVKKRVRGWERMSVIINAWISYYFIIIFFYWLVPFLVGFLG